MGNDLVKKAKEEETTTGFWLKKIREDIEKPLIKEIERLKKEHEDWIKRKDYMMLKQDNRIADLEKEIDELSDENFEFTEKNIRLEKENQELKEFISMMEDCKIKKNSLRKSSAEFTAKDVDVHLRGYPPDSQEGDKLYCSECGVMAEDCVCSLRESGEKAFPIGREKSNLSKPKSDRKNDEG